MAGIAGAFIANYRPLVNTSFHTLANSIQRVILPNMPVEDVHTLIAVPLYRRYTVGELDRTVDAVFPAYFNGPCVQHAFLNCA